MNRLAAPVAVACALMAAASARAEEGMWTFDAAPVERVEKSLGVKLDRAWLDHLRAASVRLSAGCSAALVSPEGLALTNQHCLLGCVQSLSRSDHDYVADGFLTDGRSEERSCPGLEAEVLESIADVTGPIFAASANKQGADYVLARERALAKAERDACGGDKRQRCQVIGFFGGGQYKVYRYRRYDDVRLVFAPEFASAFFGGDKDNFTFPRFDLDCAFVRLYDRGRPAATPAALAWSRQAPSLGEAVFVSGNPGRTERGATVAELESARDVSLPATETALADIEARLTAFAAASPDNALAAAERLFETENALKVVRGRRAALAAPGFLDGRRAEETALRGRIAADPKLLAQIGDPWSDAATAQKARAAEEPAWRLLESEAGGGSQLFAWARLLVRGAAERAQSGPVRLPEFSDQRLGLDRKAVIDERPVSAGLEQVLLSQWLRRCQAAFGPGSATLTSLTGGTSIEDLAAALAAGSRLSDPAVRRSLWRGGLAAVLASDDPMIAFVRRIDPLARASRQAFEDDVIGPEQRAAETIARARFALGGTDIYPDATFSLRLSWGRVAGWDDGAAKVEPFTTLAGLYARADAADPLPTRWLQAKAKVDPATVFDFATTNDITGGNSGSPVVDAGGRLLGTAFDGNAASIAGDFVYDGAQNRTVALSTAAITEALDKVYGRKALLTELGAR
ncbi:MAG TPA: S46 family peptidase [Caulobacteraceae bacterium]